MKFLVFLTLSFISQCTFAQKPYLRIARIEVDTAYLEKYKQALKEGMQAAIKNEKGVLSLQAVYDEQAPSHITVFETYASKEAYQLHIKTPHFLKYKATTLPWVKRLELVDVVPIAIEAKKNRR